MVRSAPDAQPSPALTPPPSEPFLTVDLREDIEDALRLLPWAEARRSAAPADVESCDLVSDTKNSRDQLGLVRLLLSQVLTWGLDQDTDELLVDNLNIARPAVLFASAVQRCVLLLTSHFEEQSVDVLNCLAPVPCPYQSPTRPPHRGLCRRPPPPSASSTSSASFACS